MMSHMLRRHEDRLMWLVSTVLISALVGCAGEVPRPQKPRTVREEPVLEPQEKEAHVEVKMPALEDDASCKEARAAYREAWSIEGSQRADLTNGQFGSVLARSRYFESCKVPSRYEISICAAVQNGEVLGATVRTSPRSPKHERCIDRGVRELRFPTSPRMDVTKTVFASSR